MCRPPTRSKTRRQLAGSCSVVERKGDLSHWIVPIALDVLWRDENALLVLSAPPALSSRRYRTRSSTATRRAEPEAREAALRIAGGAWSKAAAVTGRCSIVAGRRLSERRDGNERDQRESGDKLLHDTSPSWTIVRG